MLLPYHKEAALTIFFSDSPLTAAATVRFSLPHLNTIEDLLSLIDSNT
jgi:hypothetical protein